MNIFAALQGYKTYITAAAGIAGTVASISQGVVKPVEGAIAVTVLLATAFGRSGSKADADKVIKTLGSAATVVAAVTPIVAAASPGAAKVANEIGEIASEIEAAAPAAAPAA